MSWHYRNKKEVEKSEYKRKKKRAIRSIRSSFGNPLSTKENLTEDDLKSYIKAQR